MTPWYTTKQKEVPFVSKGFCSFLGEEPSLYVLCAKSKHTQRRAGKHRGGCAWGKGEMEAGKELKNPHTI